MIDEKKDNFSAMFQGGDGENKQEQQPRMIDVATVRLTLSLNDFQTLNGSQVVRLIPKCGDSVGQPILFLTEKGVKDFFNVNIAGEIIDRDQEPKP